MGIVTHFLGTFVLRLRLRGWRGRDGKRVRRDAEDKLKMEKDEILTAREGEGVSYKRNSYREYGRKKGMAARTTIAWVPSRVTRRRLARRQLHKTDNCWLTGRILVY